MGRNSYCDGQYQPLATKTYRRGEVVGFVPALHRLTVRQISNRYQPEEEPITIADLRRRPTRPGTVDDIEGVDETAVAGFAGTDGRHHERRSHEGCVVVVVMVVRAPN